MTPIKFPPGDYLFQTHLRRGGGGGPPPPPPPREPRGAYTMVSVLHKELEYKVENLKHKNLEVMQSRIKNKSELPVGE